MSGNQSLLKCPLIGKLKLSKNKPYTSTLYVEFQLIFSYLFQLYYLDECALVDTKSLSYFHILPDAKLKARVWKTNHKLVIAAKDGNWEGKIIK